jgi:RimJ/RimL family protein N-acetyltransferase
MGGQDGLASATRQIALPGIDRDHAVAPDRVRGLALPGEIVLRDGTPAVIWPLLPTDAETLRDVFRRLSPESRRHRFLQVLRQLDDPMIRLLVESVDGVHHVALLLIVLPPGGKEEPAGVARLLQVPGDPATAEIAVTVVDDWQRRGAGTALVSALMERRPPAVTRLHALADAGNHAALALLARTGRMSRGLPERGVLDVAVDLSEARQPLSRSRKVVGLRAPGAQEFAEQAYVLLQLPQASLVTAVKGYLEFIARIADVNRDLTVQWIRAAGRGCA